MTETPGPGDGSAYLSCTEGHCSCRLEPISPAANVVQWGFLLHVS
jgi:hypothetical protein